MAVELFKVMLKGVMDKVSEEFSGKEFTTEEVMEYVMNDFQLEGAGVGNPDKKVKKVKKAPKKTKMTIRQYLMTQEPEVYKKMITDRVTSHKQHNVDGCYSDDHENYKSENFFKVLKEIMSEMSESELESIQVKVNKYNSEHFPESNSEQ